MGSGIRSAIGGVAAAQRLALALALAILTLLLQPGRAEAVIVTCSVSSSGIVFSAYNSQTKAAVDGTGTITVTCTGTGSSNNLSINLVGGNSGSCTARQMRSGTNSLNYQVFRESARVNNWCDGASRLDISIDFTTGATQTRSYTMFGRVVSGQNPPFGSYSDSLTIILKQGGGTVATGAAAISGSVAAICTVTAGALGFGTYAPSTATLSTASVSVNCSNGASYQVGLGAGQNVSGTTRRMAGPGGTSLSYELFSDAARTVRWGDGSALGARVGGTGNGAAQGLTVYGRIPAAQSPTPGSYSDSVVVTVEY